MRTQTATVFRSGSGSTGILINISFYGAILLRVHLCASWASAGTAGSAWLALSNTLVVGALSDFASTGYDNLPGVICALPLETSAGAGPTNSQMLFDFSPGIAVGQVQLWISHTGGVSTGRGSAILVFQ
jgi:hypothetical protein